MFLRYFSVLFFLGLHIGKADFGNYEECIAFLIYLFINAKESIRQVCIRLKIRLFMFLIKYYLKVILEA